ncbi:MAG: phosphoglycerate mutase (2,3-diphosphoglycerate-independent) [Syntrophaceae bacterium]|nr:phosphoglycerate mutase (2,3-diphosphoglycerate-independent) [Syntrophaceae bacterium]
MQTLLTNVMSRAVREAYRRGEDDETLNPLVLVDPSGKPVGRIGKGDAVIFYNIRGEREVELSRSLAEEGFHEFPTAGPLGLHYTTMIEYSRDLRVDVAFPPEEDLEDTLSEVLSRNGIRQVKITEAEKAFHVTYFLNGKREAPYPGEDRIVIPTRKDVRLFDEAPEMSVREVAEATVREIREDRHDFILSNFANVDVVGHIENEAAVMRAVEAVDRALGLVIAEARRAGVTVLVTADHGTVERWLYPDGAVDTGHTSSPVPFVLIGPGEPLPLRREGELIDVAPTILQLFGIDAPGRMEGRSLLLAGPAAPCRRLVVIILDGWGYNPETRGNLIAKAATPVMDGLLASLPFATLAASGEAVGLPPGTVGNSEAGHLHIGAGRRVWSDRLKIDRAIESGAFFENDAFLRTMRGARSRGKALHLMGIVSFFSSHGMMNHLIALMEMARRERVAEMYIHAMLGRRGELPESGANYVKQIEDKCVELGLGRVVSVIGRYWSMDREENWDRIEKTYRMLVYGEGHAVRDGV